MPSAGYAIRLRVELQNIPGTLGRLTSAIGQAGGDIGAVDLVDAGHGVVVRDIGVNCANEPHAQRIADAARTVQGVRVLGVSDRTFDLHRGGKIAVTPKFPLGTRDDLSMAYTPGVGRVSAAIAADPELVWELTIKRNAVAVLTNGTAVLGLGDIGPEAALPVMEGKAMLFKAFAGIDAYPVCVHAPSADELVAVARAIAPGFGGINLEDVAAPVCFEVEQRLHDELDIPVFHDDQHGTAVVTLAALVNAAKVVGRPLGDLRAVMLGMGAAGIACSKLLLEAGIGDVVGVDRRGIIERSRVSDPQKVWVADNTNTGGLTGGLEEALRGADVLIGVSGPGLVRPEMLGSMAKDAIVFAMANPIPEIMPEQIPDNVRVVATGRSDYPNQINNVLVFPGIFRGLLDARARSVSPGVELAAATAIADLVDPQELADDYIVPSVFDKRVVGVVAGAVKQAAVEGGVARVDAADQPADQG
jgi:malate dehydrogenase (oxaloacetate-decarboxylating)